MGIDVLTAGEGYGLPRVFGRVIATGHLVLARTDNPRAFHLQLGSGPWAALRALYYRGDDITGGSTYHFHPGTPSAGFNDPVQGVDSFFPPGITYSEVAYLAWSPASDDTDPDPSQLVGVYDALILPDYDSAGRSLSPGFSANPARAAIQLLIDAKIDLSRVDWTSWTGWRDYCDQTLNWNSGQTPPHDPIRRFEAHVPLTSAMTISEALTILCDLSATIWQDDGVLIRFQPVGLQASTFTFDETNVIRGSVAIYEIDVREISTHQQVSFRDLDDPLLSPASVEMKLNADVDDEMDHRETSTLEYGAMTYSQAQRLGKYALRRQLPKRASFTAFGNSFAVQAGDKVTLNHPAAGNLPTSLQVLEIEDLPDEADTRRFVCGVIQDPLYSDSDHGPITANEIGGDSAGPPSHGEVAGPEGPDVILLPNVVRVRRSSAQTLTHDTDTVVLFTEETFDPSSLHSTTANTGRLTAITAGTYIVTAQITFASNATGIRVVAIRKVSGVTLTAQAVQKIDRPGQAGVGYQDTANVTTILHLAVGDYVDVVAYQDSGGSLNLVAAAYFGCEFSMALVAKDV